LAILDLAASNNAIVHWMKTVIELQENVLEIVQLAMEDLTAKQVRQKKYVYLGLIIIIQKYDFKIILRKFCQQNSTTCIVTAYISECSPGVYGENCSIMCHGCADPEEVCSRIDGRCPQSGCPKYGDDWFAGDGCSSRMQP